MNQTFLNPTPLRKALALGLLACSMTVLAAADNGKPAPAAPQAEPLARSAAAVQAAPELDLRITYEAMNIGSDGVQRDSRYTNRVYRRKGQLWIERELPAALRHSQEHGHEEAPGAHAGHAHEDARGAPLSIRRLEDGKTSVDLVLAKKRRLISVDEAHHGNVGWGGSFENSYWIVPPAALAKMERLGKPQGGVQKYKSQAGEHTTIVDWDLAGQFARRVERKDGHGTERIVVTAVRQPTPLAQPWKSLQGYEHGDYSDLLD
ncbi:hypothetical protein [Comamonas composti]|uniref:hypothetical protein n=1 Tax=Comamonas composti TaxID=408558 RepID=UPI0004212676|nr:hypothetical protein [Comamonas composti]